ncbi:hypothetical protein L208DRAFT_1397596 [Tricholoma matsutake]|nr:hypothetical protein L208DRAFT_1397596 [Tricholoma matsutake 945]
MSVKAKRVDVGKITDDDRIIALMGPTGTGKSTFIDIATCQQNKNVGHRLESYTSEVRAVRYPHPTTLIPYVLVDTPGFNDTNKTDAEVLTMIADWLKKTYKSNVKIAGIIYLHRISDNRMSGSPLKNLQMFGKLCGDGAIKKVVLATTMWTKVKRDVGERRENELKEKYWAGMLELGSQMMRFGDSFQAAWKVIDQIVVTEADKDNPLLLQEELVDLNRRLSETEAGKTLYNKLLELLTQQKETIGKLREEADAEQNWQLAKELAAQYEDMQAALQSTFDQLAKMKIPLGRRLLMLFSFRRPRGRALHVNNQ